VSSFIIGLIPEIKKEGNGEEEAEWMKGAALM
jgi:hypothetical protein